MKMQEIITQKLNVLNPQYYKIVNDSAKHSSHSSSPSSGQSHFTIEIMTSVFENKTTLEQHKIINNLLKEEFNNGLHALSIKIIKDIK